MVTKGQTHHGLSVEKWNRCEWHKAMRTIQRQKSCKVSCQTCMCRDYHMTAYKTYCQTFQVLLFAHCPTFWEGVRVRDWESWIPGIHHLDWDVVHFCWTDEPLEAISLIRSHCHQQEIYKQNIEYDSSGKMTSINYPDTLMNISH
jgi:hypothetical protein